jgi:hypothetical protein
MATCTHLGEIRVEDPPPIIRSAEPGEDWSWCYVDELAFVVEPGDADSSG